MRISLKFDGNAAKDIRDINKQARFAASVALYETARDCAELLKGDLDGEFTIRTPWVRKGIKAEPSSSKAIRSRAGSNGLLYAEVGTVDEFMALQALGGVKRRRNKAMAIPVDIRKPKTTVLTPSKWPRALLKNSNTNGKRVKRGRGRMLPFINVLRKSGNRAVLQRTGKGRYPLKMLYNIDGAHDGVTIRRRWTFQEKLEMYYPEIFEKYYGKALEKAIATAK